MSTQSPHTALSSAEVRSGRSASGWNIFVVHPSGVLTDSRAHGDGLLSYRYIRELADRGHRLSVACEMVELKHPLPPNISLYPIPLRTQKLGFAKRLEYVVRMRRLFSRLHRSERFDIAHQLNPVYAGLSLGLVGVDIPVVLGPYVAHWPVTRPSRLKTSVRDTIGFVQQRFADAIILSGPSARSRILGKRIAQSKIYTVPYGIDLDMFPEQPLPADDPVILFLAGLSERKGIRVLLAAFDIVAAKLPNARLIVAGGGAERDRVVAVAQKSPNRERITFVGTVPRSNVPKVLADCTVYCLASFGEPYGMSLVEAMATGRPVVATSSGGPLDLVDPRGGILVPPGDAAAMARALVTILEDADMARAMGAHNRQAMRAYGWPEVIDRLEQVYDRLLCRPGLPDARQSAPA